MGGGEALEEVKAYLEFPFGSSGPVWLDDAIAQLQDLEKKRQKEIQEAQGLAKEAAIRRFQAANKKKDKQRAEREKLRFTPGMGGGNANSLYYANGT